MSQAHIEQFYGKAVRDPALVRKLLEGTEDEEDFIRKAVNDGKDHGYDFSHEEANAWIKEQQRLKASGELSDSQLESVAGGKGSTATNTANHAVVQGVVQGATQFGNDAKKGITTAVNTVEAGYIKYVNTPFMNFIESW